MRLPLAILHLRPDFANRIELRNSFVKIMTESGKISANNFTYFATIPRDICEIILGLVPDLRQSIPDDYIEMIMSEYNNFANEYMQSDQKTLQPDKVAEFMKLVGSELSSFYEIVKFLPNGKKRKLQTMTHGYMYIGHNRYMRKTAEYVNGQIVVLPLCVIKSGKEHLIPNIHKIIDASIRIRFMYILPCGLLLVVLDTSDALNPHQMYLLDVEHDKYVEIAEFYMEARNLVDDFGTIRVTKLTQNMLHFSDLTPHPLHIDV